MCPFGLLYCSQKGHKGGENHLKSQNGGHFLPNRGQNEYPFGVHAHTHVSTQTSYKKYIFRFHPYI